MVAGSHAAMYYGEPRLTRDVDIIAMLTLDGLPAMLSAFLLTSSTSDTSRNWRTG